MYDRAEIKSWSLINRFWKEYEFIRSFKQNNYNIVINLTDGDRGNLIAWVSNAPIKVGFKNNSLFFDVRYNFGLLNFNDSNPFAGIETERIYKNRTVHYGVVYKF